MDPNVKGKKGRGAPKKTTAPIPHSTVVALPPLTPETPQKNIGSTDTTSLPGSAATPATTTPAATTPAVPQQLIKVPLL